MKYRGQYSVIGELQNVDNTPADVVINATLYNDDNKELANYNAKHQIKHKLMPKETTTFKIDFEGIAWSSTKDTLPPTFDPDQFTPVSFEEQPTKFNLQSAGNTANTDLYKHVALQDLKYTEQGFEGVLFNSGVQEVTIPQLIISYYDENSELLWVDHKFITEGVRIQRKQFFNYKPLELDSLEVISSSLENVFVNGLPNKAVADKIFPNRKIIHGKQQTQSFNGEGFEYLKFEINSYIGNPK